MNSQFILNYTGQKFKESKELENINFSKYKTVIEPFGGSFGFSRYLYEIKNLKNINYIIYDNDEELINFYNYIKRLLIENKFEDFINEYNKEIDYIKENFIYKDGKDKTLLTIKTTRDYVYKNIKTDNKYLIYMLKKNIFSIRLARARNKNKLKFLDIIKTTTFIHDRFNNIDFNIYDKETSLIYLDPPYLFEDNSSYKNLGDMKLFFEKIHLLFQDYNSIFIHSYNFLLDNVFKKYYKNHYTKRYGSGKVKSHYIYMNELN